MLKLSPRWWLSAAIVVCALAVPSVGQAAAPVCPSSVASLHGWYGLLISGNAAAAAVTKYQVGAVLFDGVGGVTGSNIYGAAGARSALTGTYLQNADCTLTLTLTVGNAAPATYTVALNSAGEAVGIETDATAVATISLKPQYATYTPGLNFTTSSLSGTFVAACLGPLAGDSDLNLVTFDNGGLFGTDPYNNGGNFGVANVPYSGTYAVNPDGTFSGALTVLGTNFDFFGVLSTANTTVQYIYSDVSNGQPTDAFSACVGSLAAGSVGAGETPGTPDFYLNLSPTTITLGQNAAGLEPATDILTIGSLNGFTGNVALSLSGLPSGWNVSATRVNITTSGTSALTITPKKTAAAGTYTLTFKATSGSIVHTSTLTVVAP